MKHDMFDNIDSQKKAYLLGYVYAKGWATNYPYINIVVGIKKFNHLQYIASQFECTNILSVSDDEEKVSLGMYSKKLFMTLTKDYRCNPMSFYRSYPYIPKEFDNDFIRGFIDGNCVVSDDTICVYGSTHIMQVIKRIVPLDVDFKKMPAIISSYRDVCALYNFMYDRNTIVYDIDTKSDIDDVIKVLTIRKIVKKKVP